MSDDGRERGRPEAAAEGEDLLELILAEHAPPPARIDGVMVGRLVGLGAGGEPLVDFPGAPRAEGVAARALCTVAAADAGREVALLFEGGDPARPVLMGLMHQPVEMGNPAAFPLTPPGVTMGNPEGPPQTPPEVEATRDGERVVFEAEKEIVLRCGKAQITLTRAGKILIKGAYVLTRSTGVNRIQGGSVQIN